MLRGALVAATVWTLGGCAPSEDELRALGQARLGTQGRTVAIGYIDPQARARDCCCPTEARWFELSERPETCEIYPETGEDDRFFRGTSFLDPACLTAQGFLEPLQVRRQVVACANVACEGDATGGPAPLEETVQVFVATGALTALARESTKVESVEYFVGYDTLGDVLEQKRSGWDAIDINFQLKETVTPLEQCVVEGRSRRPSNNRKQDFQFRREDGVWR